MADEVAPFSLQQQFPVLRLFDAATIALSPFSIFTAALTVVVISASSLLLDSSLRPNSPQKSIETSVELDIVSEAALTSRAKLTVMKSEYPAPFAAAAISNSAGLEPWRNVIEPAASSLDASSFNARLNRLLKFAIALGLWSVVGTVLCRRAANLFAGEDEVAIMSSINFGLRRWQASVGAPSIPLIAAVLFGLVLFGIGLVGRLPWLGPLWLIATSPVSAVIGFVIAFLLIVTAASWPLMMASIATDDCDSFGSLSRAYSGLTSKPWHVLLYLISGCLAGWCLLTVIHLFAETTIWCAVQGIGLAGGREAAEKSLRGPLTAIVHLVATGVGASFFWSLATIASLLLRQEVDGAPLDRISNHDLSGEARDPLPVVGMPATDAPPPAIGPASIENG